jgi:drug/metabolite transporter (DMT)-like permease
MKKSIVADLVLLCVTFFWGATFVLVKGSIETMPPFTFLGVRFLFGALVLYLFMHLFFRDSLRQLTRGVWRDGTLLGLFLFVGYAFQTFGLKYTTASNAGFITGLQTVLVPIFSLWLLRHRLKLNGVIGVALAFFGMAMLSLNGQLRINFGDALVFFCALSYGLHITFVGIFAPRYSALPLALTQVFTCGLMNMIAALLFEDVTAALSPSVVFDPFVFLSLLICAVFATSIAFVAQTQFQKFTTPTKAAVIFATEPVFAALTGFLWDGDRLSNFQWFGCLLILSGMLISELRGHNEGSTAEAK